MWLLGLVIGAGFGAVFDHVFQGALLGLVIGIALTRRREDPGNGASELRARVEQLERDHAALTARLVLLERGERAPSDEVAGALPLDAVPVASGAAGIPAAIPPAPRPAPPLAPAPPVRGDAADAAASPSVENLPVELWRRLLAGNLLAKIGVALLFFGVASALKVAVAEGWFPPLLRLAAGALAGVGMVAFGWSRRVAPAHRAFSQVFQGGGYGLFYLMVHFAYAWYGVIGAGLAFAAFALLGLGCVIMAVAQEASALAIFGLTGAFLAPVLAASGRADLIVLLFYFLLLNGFIVGLAWYRDWRALPVCGFLLTFLVGLASAINDYRPVQYPAIQGFLALFFLLYSATPCLLGRLRVPGYRAWQASPLLFGTPVAALLLQVPLVRGFQYGMAWSALLAGIYYLGLWLELRRQDDPESRLLRQGYFGIGLSLLTLAVPLAFGALLTVAVWSMEGAATLWWSLRLGRPVGQAFGLLVQVLAGWWLLMHAGSLAEPRLLVNGVFTGGSGIALAGIVSAFLLRSRPPAPRLPGADPLLTWGLAWWYGTTLHENHVFAPATQAPGLGLLIFAGTAVIGELAGRHLDWTTLRRTCLLLWPASVVALTLGLGERGEILHGAMLAGLFSALGCQYWALYRQEADHRAPDPWLPLLHAGSLWLLTFVLTHDAVVLADRWDAGADRWPILLAGLVPTGLGVLAVLGIRRATWPFGAHRAALTRGFVTPLSLLLAGWLLHVTGTEPGARFGPYIPGLDPLDLSLVAIFLGVAVGTAAESGPPPWRSSLLLLLALTLLGGLAARCAHHLGGVPFTAAALVDSALFQALLSVLWTALAISLMLRANRNRHRETWFVGFGLLAVVGAKLLLADLSHSDSGTWAASLIGIALLVLAAAYFAPVPPRRESGGTTGLSGPAGRGEQQGD